MESLEEIVCLAECDGELELIALVDNYGDHGTGVIFDPRWRVIEALRAQSVSSDSATLRERLAALETVDVIHEPRAVPFYDGKNFYRIRTWLGSKCVEDIGSLHLSFDGEANPAEFRRAYRLNDPSLHIRLLEDGDGFGRTVRFIDRAELVERWDKIHAPSRQFPAVVLGLKPRE